MSNQVTDRILRRLDERIESHSKALIGGQAQDYTQYRATVTRVQTLQETRDEIADLARRHAAGETDDD
jgi:hypothetical protein